MVPLDFAKITHYACFCDGRGTYVRKAFTVKNNQEAVDYLVDQIERTRAARSIKSKRHVIIGGEDSASYTRNFMDRLFELGYLTVRLDSKEVHRQAESVDSSTEAGGEGGGVVGAVVAHRAVVGDVEDGSVDGGGEGEQGSKELIGNCFY